MTDVLAIALTDVPVSLRLGVPRAERERPQTVLVSLTLTRTRPPPFDPEARLSETVDYATLIAFLKDGLPAKGPFVLVESIAEAVVAQVRALAGEATYVTVEVKKPSVLGGDGMVAVRLERGRRQ